LRIRSDRLTTFAEPQEKETGVTQRTLTPVLTRRWAAPESWTIDTYTRLDGYKALRAALAAHPDRLIQLIKDSGLRGRGGAGFPTGMKWGFIPQAKPGEQPTGPAAKPTYLVINADEGEPGTCKDVPLMMADPHSLVEGCIITAYAIRAHRCFIYVRGEVVHCLRRVHNAVREAYAAGYLGDNILGSGFDLDIVVHAGAGAYEAGEETALLNSLEGFRAEPRLKPPFPATSGLYAAPTVVNNVETICTVPYIVNGGSDWFRKMGTEKSPGPKIYSISGHVQRPGQYEAPLGTTLRELLELAGGMKGQLKFWTPGGSSTPLLTADHLDVPLDFEGAAGAGSMLGTTAVMVFNTTVSVPWAVMKWTEFYEHESCGKCTPCREGTYWLTQILQRMVRKEGTPSDVETMLDICDNIFGRSFCALGDGAVSPIRSGIKYFRQEFLDLCAQQPGHSKQAALSGSVR
jgi:NADH-quinone oxidoreductase subunit F